ncbi:alpha/beta hydrolase [Microbispora sp. H10830]|uniref:alpha/beta hydrolase n=1 Tax=Microbispora sp. H10830 TaxID=2729109 RepID=UPI001601AEA0|nr:alpha/beta hydrolase [Microbispora sp. H10830]
MNPTPVVFIHGVWLHASSWESWTGRFSSFGFAVCAPGWPGEPATVGEARRRPEALQEVGLGELTDHYARIVRSFDTPPVIVGHSVGGLIAQHLLGTNAGRAAVAIAPAPVDHATAPAPGEPWPVSMDAGRFRRLFANAVTEQESAELFERHIVPGSRRLLAELGHGGAVRHPRAVVDHGNTGRGPLLLISGQEDRLVPDHVTRTVYKLYGDSTATSSFKQFPDRAHSLVVDSGWRAVADYVLAWLAERGVRADPSEW